MIVKSDFLSVIAIFLLSLYFVSPLHAADKASAPKEPMDSLLLSMSTDNTEVIDGAITIGTVALKRGHEVTMLLRLDSIKVAVSKNSYPVGETVLAKRLSEFMKNGAKVIVGGKCMKDMKLTPKDLLKGVAVGTPDLVMGTIFKKETKILSY